MIFLGVKLGQLLKRFNIGKIVDVSFFSNKVVVIDALPTIYEMLAMIRDKRGLYLVDSKGRVTSHLVGLFYRICRMITLGIKPIFVFDGPPHPLKLRELETRKKEKERFQKKYIEAVLSGKYDEAKKLGKRAMFVNDEMIKSAKQLIKFFGLPIINAPHDGEAQAAYIVSKGEAFAVASRDWDCLLYGAPRLVMDLKFSPTTVYRPRLYELNEVLSKLNLSHEQLIDLALLLGTDYNPEGFKGIGVVKAYNLIRKYGSLEALVNKSVIIWKFDVSLDEIKDLFLHPIVSTKYSIMFEQPKYDKIVDFLVNEYNFSKKRVLNELNELRKKISIDFKAKQMGLDSFFE